MVSHGASMPAASSDEPSSNSMRFMPSLCTNQLVSVMVSVVPSRLTIMLSPSRTPSRLVFNQVVADVQGVAAQHINKGIRSISQVEYVLIIARATQQGVVALTAYERVSSCTAIEHVGIAVPVSILSSALPLR